MSPNLLAPSMILSVAGEGFFEGFHQLEEGPELVQLAVRILWDGLPEFPVDEEIEDRIGGLFNLFPSIRSVTGFVKIRRGLCSGV